MKSHLSPKDLARVIDASESSIKRWIDQGLLAAERTPGGHRRISAAEAARFIRRGGHAVQCLESLGMSDAGPVESAKSAGMADRLEDALLGGLAAEAESMVLRAYLEGASIADLCDGAFLIVLQRIGELWHSRSEGVFLEHRATEICVELLRTLFGLQPVTDEAPVAVGGAGPGELHAVPSLMAAAVLAAEGFRSVNLGSMTPIESLRQAVETTSARIAWLSVGMDECVGQTAAGLGALIEACRRSGVTLVVGGRGAQQLRLPPDDLSTFLADSMGALGAFARGVRSGGASGAASASSDALLQLERP